VSLLKDANGTAGETYAGLAGRSFPAPVSDSDLDDYREIVYNGSRFIFKDPATIDVTRYLPEGQSAISASTDLRPYILQAQAWLATQDASKSVTGVASTNVFTSVAHGYSNEQQLFFSVLTGGAGLSLETPYYVINKTADTFEVSATLNGSAVNFTTDLTAGTTHGFGRGRIVFPRLDGIISGYFQLPPGQYWDGLGRSDSPPTLLRATNNGQVIRCPVGFDGGIANMKIIGKIDGTCPDQDLLTVGNGTVGVTGGWSFENLKLEQAGRDALVLNSAIQTRCTQVVGRTCDRYGLYMKGQSNASSFNNCDFTGNQDWGRVIEGGTGIAFTGVCVTEGNGLGGTGGGTLVDPIASVWMSMFSDRHEGNWGPGLDLPEFQVDAPAGSDKTVTVTESGCVWLGRSPAIVLNWGRWTSEGSSHQSTDGEGTTLVTIAAAHDGAVFINPKGGTSTNPADDGYFVISDSSGRAVSIMDGVVRSGKGLRVLEGSNCKQGAATLVGGTVTVSNTSVTANSRILVTSQVDGGTPGWLRVSARTASTSFTITSSSGTDTSTVAYQIFEPA
jgi:hypothetical protein